VDIWRCSDKDENWFGALSATGGNPGRSKGRSVSANPGDVSTRASNASEHAQRVAGAETAKGFQLLHHYKLLIWTLPRLHT